jgi:hypothetical protein
MTLPTTVMRCMVIPGWRSEFLTSLGSLYLFASKLVVAVVDRPLHSLRISRPPVNECYGDFSPISAFDIVSMLTGGPQYQATNWSMAYS